jgi:ABC-2 type transport system permease protein
VNPAHLRAFVWLRWRLRVNQLKKGGIANTVLLVLLAVGAVVLAVGMFVGGLAGGFFGMPQAGPVGRLIVWDAVVVAFLFTWMIGLLTELQRTDVLTLDKFLHLPVSPAGVFLVNYLSSLVTLSTVLFVPAMVGLALGQVLAGQVAMLLALPLIAAFVLAVTGVTNLFQGWLAALMSNPRRRRTIIVFLTLGFILLAQLPNLINLARMGATAGPDEAETWQKGEQEAAAEAQKQGKLTPAEYARRLQDIDKEYQEREAAANQQTWQEAGRMARVVNAVLPPGWLPLGAAALPDWSVVPALLGTLGLAGIGGLCLWRSYRSVLRFYTGPTGGGERRANATAATKSDRVPMIEWRLPGVSEHSSAVAAAGLRSLTRAPEAKMMLVAPIIAVVVFGGLLATKTVDPPEPARPLMALGGAAMVLLMGVQLVGNQFGYDRAGFRAFVLSPVPRREVLLGKNLAVAPVTLGLAAAVVLLVGVVFPMRPDHYVAVAALLIAMFLVYCLLANALSIAAPIPMASGALKPSNTRLVPVLLQMLFMFVFPLAMLPALAPVGIEAILAELGVLRGWPVALALALVVLPATVAAYRKVLTWEGDWLAAREQAILEVVTSKAEG